MRSATIRTSTTALLTALAVSLTACGFGADRDPGGTTDAGEDTAEQDQAPDPSESPDEPQPAEDTTEESDSAWASGGFSANCAAFLAEVAAIQSAYAESFGNVMAGGQIAVEGQRANLQAMADAAPAEIQADFQTYARILGEYFEILAEVDFRPGEQPEPEQMEKLARAAENIDTAALEQASANIEAYLNANC